MECIKGTGKMRKKNYQIEIILMVILIVIINITACGSRGLIKYDSFDDFQMNTKTEFYLPDGAEEQRMAINDKGFSKTYLLSFVLDDDELDSYISKFMHDKYGISETDGAVEDIDDIYYGHYVREINDLNATYTLDDFMFHLAFDAVIDDSVEEYKVLWYYPVNTGSRGEAILINYETNRVLQYYYGAIK